MLPKQMKYAIRFAAPSEAWKRVFWRRDIRDTFAPDQQTLDIHASKLKDWKLKWF